MTVLDNVKCTKKPLKQKLNCDLLTICYTVLFFIAYFPSSSTGILILEMAIELMSKWWGLGGGGILNSIFYIWGFVRKGKGSEISKQMVIGLSRVQFRE